MLNRLALTLAVSFALTLAVAPKVHAADAAKAAPAKKAAPEKKAEAKAPEKKTEAKVETARAEPPKAAAGECCKTCKNGKACGNTCIAKDRECAEPKGCACDP